jgi:hypothetical protein
MVMQVRAILFGAFILVTHWFFRHFTTCSWVMSSQSVSSYRTQVSMQQHARQPSEQRILAPTKDRKPRRIDYRGQEERNEPDIILLQILSSVPFSAVWKQCDKDSDLCIIGLVSVHSDDRNHKKPFQRVHCTWLWVPLVFCCGSMFF